MNPKALWERIRGYLPKYPGPSRSISQDHIIGGAVTAAIILGAIYMIQPGIIFTGPRITVMEDTILSLQNDVRELLVLYENSIDEIKNLTSQYTELEDEFILTKNELQGTNSILKTREYDVDELSDTVWNLEKDLALLLGKINTIEEVTEPFFWDYVALGISFGQVEDYVNYYAEFIEEDMGIIVRLHDWRIEGLRYNEFINQLQENQELRALIQKADVITIDTTIFEPIELTEAIWDNDTDKVEELTEYVKADIDTILDELLTLCSVNKTIIRTDNGFNPGMDWQKEHGIYQIAKPFIDTRAQHIVTACFERNIPCVMTYQALNGPDGEEMIPEEFQGVALGLPYINEAGHRFIAELYREMAYAPFG